MEKDISRINIEQEEQWLKVKANVVNASKASLETRLRGNSALRKEVESRLNKIMEDGFTMANKNLRVNGHNYEDYITVTEPFDESLDNKMWALATEVAEREAKSAEKNTRRPEQINNVVVECAKMDADMEWLPEDAVEEVEDEEMEVNAPPPRHVETVQTFQRTLENLQEIIKIAPTQLSRAERAKVVKEQISAIRS